MLESWCEMEQQGVHLQNYIEEKQKGDTLSSYQHLMTTYIDKMEQILKQYRNVVEQASSLETMNMGKILLPQMQDNIQILEQCHDQITEKNHQK